MTMTTDAPADPMADIADVPRTLNVELTHEHSPDEKGGGTVLKSDAALSHELCTPLRKLLGSAGFRYFKPAQAWIIFGSRQHETCQVDPDVMALVIKRFTAAGFDMLVDGCGEADGVHERTADPDPALLEARKRYEKAGKAQRPQVEFPGPAGEPVPGEGDEDPGWKGVCVDETDGADIKGLATRLRSDAASLVAQGVISAPVSFARKGQMLTATVAHNTTVRDDGRKQMVWDALAVRWVAARLNGWAPGEFPVRRFELAVRSHLGADLGGTVV